MLHRALSLSETRLMNVMRVCGGGRVASYDGAVVVNPNYIKGNQNEPIQISASPTLNCVLGCFRLQCQVLVANPADIF